jgi:hypothetical protein
MIKAIFDEIAAEPGTNKKMEILGKYKDNELLKRVLYLANSKRVKFYIKQIPSYKPSSIGDTYGMLENNLDALARLSSRELSGHAAIQHLTNTLQYSHTDDAYIIERIIEKDCKIGMGTTNINKIFPGLIEKTPYMGAVAYEKEVAQAIFDEEGPHISQIKMDGRYANAIIRAGDVELESREGEPNILNGAKVLSELALFSDCVLNGEFTIDGLSRYESNGIIASLISIGGKELAGEEIKKEITKLKKKHNVDYKDALNSIVYTIWDIISVDEYFNKKSEKPYHERLSEVIFTMMDLKCEKVRPISSVLVSSFEEAVGHFNEVLNKGGEGTILKSRNGKWKNGKPNWQVKMKLEMDVDLKITGFNYGTGKNAKFISSVNAESTCGKVVTSPTGIEEDMMKFITENQDRLMGSILEVKCSGLSKDSKGQYSLLHPVFKKLRDDKTDGNTLEEIIGIENMIKGLN